MALSLSNMDKTKLQESMIAALHEQNENKYVESMTALFEVLQKETLEKAQELAGVKDTEILQARGVRVLTSQEKKYFEKLGEAMRAENPKQALTNPELVMPETVINAVFDDLQTEHPLLSSISFTNTQGAIKFLMSNNDYQKAVWGKLCATITEEIESSFKEIDMTLMKLSAFIPVCEAMLDLGPAWLDSYVRQYHQQPEYDYRTCRNDRRYDNRFRWCRSCDIHSKNSNVYHRSKASYNRSSAR